MKLSVRLALSPAVRRVTRRRAPQEPSDDENDMLDLAFGLTQTSRLGCQVVASKELDGLVVRLPSVRAAVACVCACVRARAWSAPDSLANSGDAQLRCRRTRSQAALSGTPPQRGHTPACRDTC